MLEKTLESPLDCKEIQPVHPKGDQSWVFNGRTDAEAETPILWLPDAKSWLIWKDRDAGKDLRWEEKGTTEDEIVGWHHRLNGQEFGWTLGVGDGQGVLACCGPWGRKESDTTEQLNWLNETKTVRCYVISCNKGCGVGGLVAKLCPTLATPWNVACQAPLSMGFSRQEYWSGLPFPSPIMKVNYYYYSPNMPSLEELGCCLTALLSLPKASSGVCLSVVSQKALPALPGFHLSRQTQKQQGLPLWTIPVRRLTPLS